MESSRHQALLTIDPRTLPKEEAAVLALYQYREECKRDVYKLSKDLLGMKDTNWNTHGDMIEVLESKNKRKLIVMPRGTFKSSIAGVAYPIQVLANDPNARILIDSEVFINSKNHLRAIKAHLQSEQFIRVFGDWKSDTNWADGSITVKGRTKPLKEPSITCGGIGTVKVGQHYDLIIFDDLNSNNNSLTPEGCQKVIDHYRMSIALLEPNGTIVVVGTRYSSADLIQFILDNEVKNAMA